MVSKIDRRRLNDGASAMALGKATTEEEIVNQLDILHDSIAAMQSLDDLGSPKANNAAMKDMDSLIARMKRLEKQLKKIRACK